MDSTPSSEPPPDLVLTSSEIPSWAGPRKAWILRSLRNAVREDLKLVWIEPPGDGRFHGLGEEDLHEMILATRHRGETLDEPVTRKMAVYIVFSTVPIPADGFLADSEFRIMAWGEVHPGDAWPTLAAGP
jgi:hypothetical protein